jgi:ribonuclease P protein component
LSSKLSISDDCGVDMLLHCFPKTARLLNASDYKAVFDGARYKVSSRHFLFLAISSRGIRSRLGLVIPKKQVAKATARNRLKRSLRERFRLCQHEFGMLDIVVLARKDADKLRPHELNDTIDSLLSDLKRRAHKDQQRQRAAEAGHHLNHAPAQAKSER